MTSFFGSSKKADPKKPETSAIIATGGEIDSMVGALCQHANDTEQRVRRTIMDALLDIGRKQPNLVLSSCLEFLRKDVKAEQRHRITLLKVIEQILAATRGNVDESLGQPLVEQALSEMTREKEVLPDWQGGASSVLVSLGMRWPNLVLEQLMSKFSPGTVPHYFVMKTLGDFAVANPLAVVPQLKDCLARMLPVLGGIKADNLKWVFASTLGKFCDAIMTYVVDSSQSGLPTESLLTKDSFSGEIYPAYELLFNNWLGSREPKVRAATVQTIGSMCAILTPSQFEVQLPKILAGMLALYKKDKDHLPVTMGMCVVLEVAVKDESRVLYPHLNNLLTALHTMACMPIEMDQADSVKNNNELMRCFGIMSKVFNEDVLTFLLARLDIRISKNTKDRLGTLEILRHLVTRLGAKMGDCRGLLVSGIQPSERTETVVKVRKSLAQLIITMASHDYLSLEGGTASIEFIAAQCAVSDADIQAARAKEPPADKKKPGGEPTEADELEELRGMCDNILNLVSTTVPCMENVLWPYLLELLIPPKFTPALSIICKCIAHLASTKRQNEDPLFFIDFAKQVNVPKPWEIVARLFVMLTVPQRRGRLGLHILHALHAIGPVLSADLPAMWDSAIPRLAHYLQTNADTPAWDGAAWEELIIRLLAETIKIINSEEWTLQLGDALFAHLKGYEGDSELRKTCFKHIGLVLQKLTKKDYIHRQLEAMFEACVHNNDNERLGVAVGYGYAAASHLDTVLEKLNSAVVRHSGGKKPSSSGGGDGGGLFGLFSAGPSTKQPEGSGLDTALLAFGYVTAYASPSLITTRIDVHIVNNLKPQLTNVKSTQRKEILIKSLELIGKSMHPTHLGAPYVLKQRDDLINSLLQFVLPEEKEALKPVPSVTLLGLQTLATFVSLQPIMPEKLLDTVVEKVCTFIKVQAVPPESAPKVDNEKDAKDKKGKSKAGQEEKDLELSKAVNGILQGLHGVLGAVLSMDSRVPTLHRLFNHLRKYTSSADPLHRERAVDAVLFLLKKFVEFKTTEAIPEGQKKEKAYAEVGSDLAFIIPRCTDPIVQVRQRSIEAIGTMLYIDHVLRSSSDEDEGYNLQPPQQLRPLNAIRDRVASSTLNDQYAVMQDLAGILCQMITPEELPGFLHALFPALTDSQLAAASGSCIILNGMIKGRGGELGSRVSELVSALLAEMNKITQEQTLNATLHAIRHLGHHHTLPVIDQLLQAPVPHPPVVIKSFQVLARDPELVGPLIEHLTYILNYTLLMEDKGGKKNEPLPIPVSVTCALGEVLQTQEMAGYLANNYATIVGTLLLRFGTSVSNPTTLKQITDTWKAFMDCGKDEKLKELMDRNDIWKRITAPDYHVTIAEMTGVIGAEHPDTVADLYKFFYPFLKGNYPGHVHRLNSPYSATKANPFNL
eukprot:TRINITY_DN1587_c0_g1_i1.p1 TRINITY_DN1587_c0_g1~~TRINITY_DN1587_c0_g1_i1.p1  ORF type:complete len:1410 (-),score=232.80 TRINITY_DN1587_c0_g1_i1:1013-5242(-)